MERTSSRRQDLLTDALRRFVRRGARGHLVKMLSKLRPGDVAPAFLGLTPAERFTVFGILTEEFPDSAGDVLTELDPPVRVALLEKLGAEEIASLLERLSVDDAVAIVETLPPELQEPVLELVDGRDLEGVQHQLAFEDDSAGRIMDPEFFALSEDTTVGEAVATIQTRGEVEMIFYLYLVDEGGRLVGVTSLRQLLLTEPGKSLAEIMQRDVIRVSTDTDQEEVADLAAQYDLLAIPVTDFEDRLVGIVTFDDIVDVLREEATEDFFKLVGTSDDELLYEERAVKVAGIRLPWLLINLCALTGGGLILEKLQTRLSDAMFLLAFAPVVMGMGGNSGTQTATITVRGLATGRIALGKGRVWPFFWHQAKVGAILGLATAAVGSLLAFLLVEPSPRYVAVVAVALFVALLVASVSGALIPILFERLGVDPAVAAGPIVTTANDISGLLIYFGLAALVLDQLR